MLNTKLLMTFMSIAFTLNTLHADTNTTQNTQEGTISFYHENYLEAQKFLSKASEAGDPSAHYYLGLMYLNGHGVPTNYQEAARFFSLGAQKNHPGAQIALSVLLIEGIGVPQNFKRAAMLLTLAAKQNNQDAQAILGWIYKYGVGVRENKVIAYALWNYVAAKGDEWARINRNYIMQELTEEELYKAQDLSLNLASLWNVIDNKQTSSAKSIKKKKEKNTKIFSRSSYALSTYQHEQIPNRPRYQHRRSVVTNVQDNQ
jgi:TPR repeat protein